MPGRKTNIYHCRSENRGNSIAPFFDAKKKLPELFGEKIYISKDEVAAKVSKLNEKIENILQDRLGNQYDNIFDYAKDTPDYDLNVELIMLYDFPRGFDERTLAELRNVLRNGSKCGIYTVIHICLILIILDQRISAEFTVHH